MKICYVATDVFIPGVTGSSTHTYEVARHLLKLGHKVFLVCRRQHGQRKYEVLNGIHIHRIYRGIVLPTRRVRRVSWARRNFSLKQNFHHIYLHTVFFFYAGPKIAKFVKDNVIDVILERGTSSGEGTFAAIITGRSVVLEAISPHCSSLSVKKARKILTFSKNALKKAPVYKIEVVKAAANTELFNPSIDGALIRTRYSLDGCPVIGYVGSFAMWHGIETLIHAMRNVVQRKPNAKLLLVGPYPDEIRNLIDTVDLTRNVSLIEPVPYKYVPLYLAACDILVAPYSSRQWGSLYSYVKIYEYMAMGKPVVTTNIIPDARMIKLKESGMLVPPDDPKKLSEAMLTLLDNKELVFKLGHRARQVSLEYSWQAYAKRLIHIIEKALED